MPTAPTVARTAVLALSCPLVLGACQVGSTPAAPPGAPSPGTVTDARYTRAVELDHGKLLITPPPGRASVAVSADEARAMFEATDAVSGPHEFAILGLGVVTVAPSAEAPPTTTTTTTTAAPGATVAPTTAPPTTAPPTTAPTTAPTSVPTTAAAPPVTSPILPGYRRRLAWVGIAWGAPRSCGGSGRSGGSTTTSTTPVSTADYVAVIIDARTPHRVIAYRSAGATPCAGAPAGPTVTEPDELLSVAWQPVGPTSTAVQIEIPACGHYFGWTQVPTGGGSTADQVVVSVPFDPTCGALSEQTQVVDQVVPLGSGQSLVAHAPVGPVQALQGPPLD
ncbi:MAG TPA: hypothetical protein VMF60_07325 [Acidimicrobiales bacterium]|nr:hypothetical protein [Acidimicrobiales bacterium]